VFKKEVRNATEAHIALMRGSPYVLLISKSFKETKKLSKKASLVTRSTEDFSHLRKNLSIIKSTTVIFAQFNIASGAFKIKIQDVIKKYEKY
jgi:hypothetical protein